MCKERKFGRRRKGFVANPEDPSSFPRTKGLSLVRTHDKKADGCDCQGEGGTFPSN